MSRTCVVFLSPSAFVLTLAVTGCGVSPQDAEQREPLPRLFQNKDVWELPVPMNSQFRPGPEPGTATGGEHQHNHDHGAPPAGPSRPAAEKTDPDDGAEKNSDRPASVPRSPVDKADQAEREVSP
jgi:hypothetical protein